METWNREELYKEIWEQPMLKLAPKYGISSVMPRRVCRKLRIPGIRRGAIYWAALRMTINSTLGAGSSALSVSLSPDSFWLSISEKSWLASIRYLSTT